MPLFSFFESLNCASNSGASQSSRKKSRLGAKKLSKSKLTTNPSAPHDEQHETISYEQNGDVESFWDIGKYKIALKRCDNGQKLATDLSELISERAKLEDNYGKSIKAWSQKWTDTLNKEAIEYESTKEAWVN